jgi:hypothetical protein
MNRLFDEPLAVFNERMLKPELQGMEDFVDGINNITEAMQRAAMPYFEDGSVEAAIPPLQVLLHIMAYGNYKGKDISDPELRKMFKKEEVIKSEWYEARLKLKQEKDIDFYKSQINYLEDFIANRNNNILIEEMNIAGRLEKARELLDHAESKQYIKELTGTIGADPLFMK